jgi:hypothetical protein
MSVSSALGAAGYSWGTGGKDHDKDGNITREEFKLPVEPGTGTIVPADLRAAGSLDDAFNSYDHNRDGIIDADEINFGSTPQREYPPDRFHNDWADRLTAIQAQRYFDSVNADNARLAEVWGLEVQGSEKFGAP